MLSCVCSLLRLLSLISSHPSFVLSPFVCGYWGSNTCSTGHLNIRDYSQPHTVIHFPFTLQIWSQILLHNQTLHNLFLGSNQVELSKRVRNGLSGATCPIMRSPLTWMIKDVIWLLVIRKFQNGVNPHSTLLSKNARTIKVKLHW